MDYKIFVSDKYGNDSICPLSNPMCIFSSNRCMVRDYVGELNPNFSHTNNIYRGESENGGLSYLPDDANWEKLSMKVFYCSEGSQWIPWKIACSS